MALKATVTRWYKQWLRRKPDAGGLKHHVANRTSELEFARGARKELHDKIDSLKGALKSTRTQLNKAKNKKPEVVVKEVEKIVKEIVEVEKEVEKVVVKDPAFLKPIKTFLANMLKWIQRK